MLIEKPVLFTNEGQQLVGILHEPVDGGKGPGVIMFHGFKGNSIGPHRIFVKTARALANLGFYVLRFDFRGSGNSEGDFKDMTISSEISDALASVAWLKENTGVDPDQIGILGLSLGGCVAAYTAVQTDTKGLVLWASLAKPIDTYRDVPYEVMKNMARTYGFMDHRGWQMGLSLLVEVPSINPLEVVEEYTRPSLIIHGTEDKEVPVEHGKDYYAHLGSEDKELHLIEGAGHTFDKVKWETEVIDKTVAWFDKRLKK